MNRKADFLLNESIRIDSHNESNRIDSNRELECSTEGYIVPPSSGLNCTYTPEVKDAAYVKILSKRL